MKEEMRVESDLLTPKQKQAVILLARGATVKEAAENIGVTETTIYNWKTSEDFQEDLRDETRAYVNDVRTSLAALMTPAIEVLKKLLSHKNPNIQLKVIDKIFKSNGFESLNPQLFSCKDMGLETPLYEEEEKEARRKNLFDSLGGF